MAIDISIVVVGFDIIITGSLAFDYTYRVIYVACKGRSLMDLSV